MNETQPQRIAIIDLGSNTNRLIIMETQLGFSYRLVDEVREVVRLRQGMSEAGLSDEAVIRGLSTLRLYKDFCEQTNVRQILAVATSAVREAANGPAFPDRIRDEIGISIQLLDGEKEAYYDTLGALNEVPLIEGVVLDIGGGSIQLSDVQKIAIYSRQLRLPGCTCPHRTIYHPGPDIWERISCHRERNLPPT